MEDCLPENFAERVIELQSMLDEHYSMELIHGLNQLYRIAIDYYVRQQPRKAMHFQKKMTNLLSNPKTLTIIQEPLRKDKHTQNNQYRKNFKFQDKMKDQVLKFQNFSDQYIRNIIQSSQKTFKRNTQLRDVDLNKQQQKLEERILLKKIKSQQKLKIYSPRKSRDEFVQ